MTPQAFSFIVKNKGFMLCYVMLCHVTSRHVCVVLLCYVVMLCYIMLCYVVLCCVVLCYVMLLCYVAVPQPRTEFYKRSLSYSGSVLWNGLPLEVRQLTSPSIFKGKLIDINFD